MNPRLTVEPATPAEWPQALRLAFQHLPPDMQQARLQVALELIQNHEIDPDGVLVARRDGVVKGALVCLLVPGASALLWPPQVAREVADRTAIEDCLIQQATVWLRRRGAKLGQTMLVPEETHLAATLQRNGFPHVTTLYYLRLDLHRRRPGPPRTLRYQSYPADPELFQQTLLRTYEDTQDCPELTGVRTIGEIIEGHRAQGIHDPELWWLAFRDNRPVGVLLLTRMPEWNSWDVAYVGVTADARRQGLGRELMHKAITEARRAQAPSLTLSVDGRNQAAWRLYQGLGFETFDQREVFLALWHQQ